MKNDDKGVLQYGYQPGSESKGYQPSTNTQNATQNTTQNSNVVPKPPKGGNAAQKD